MNISGNSTDSTFTVGLSTDKIQDLGGTVEIDLSDNKINLIAPDVLVNGAPIGGGGGIQNPLSSNLSIGAFDITGLSNGQTLQGINTDVIALEEKTVNITLASFPVSTTMVGILTVDNLKTNDIKDILETSTISLNVGGVDITSTNLNFNGNPLVYSPYPSSIEAGSFIKSGGLSTQYLLADGSTLVQSAVSGNSNFYLYANQLTLTPPPDNGRVRYNNAIQKDATLVYISHLTSDGVDIDIFFNNVSTLNDVYIQDKMDSANFIQYNITAPPTLLPNQYITIPVVFNSFSGTGETSFGNNHPLILSFFVNNLEVDTRISNLETKTQNQTAILGTTTLSGLVDIPTLETNLIRDKTSGTAEIFLSAGLIEIVASTLQFNNEEVVYNNFPNQLVAQSYRKTGATSDEFLKGDGTTDINAYSNIQYLMTTAPATVSNTAVETQIIGTGLNSNNMSMTWLDGLNFSREIYISGMIRYLASAVLTVRFRLVGSSIKINWPITLPLVSVGPTMIPFRIHINYTIFTPNLYQANAVLTMAGVVTTNSFMYNGSQACVLGNFNRTVSAQWGTASTSNQLTITELMVKNNYVG
jgi:hypothetical protein